MSRIRFLPAFAAVLLLCVLTVPGAAFAQNVDVDWDEGTWTFAEVPEGEQVSRLTFAGDWRPARIYESMFRENPEAPYGELMSTIRESDVRVVNVETTIGTKGSPFPKGGPNFQADPAFVSGLTAVPFDVAVLANNHAADYGPPSVKETIANLRRVGVKPVGAGMTEEEAAEPLFLDVNGTSVAIIACAEGEEGRSIRGGAGVNGMNVHKQVSQIRRLRGMVDLVVVSFHGGREHLPSPPPYVTYALRSFAEAGADAVVAHHPHVPQGIEVVDGTPIVYSQGNFIFWQDEDYYKQVGYLVHLDIADDRLIGMSLTPYQQTQNGLVHLQEPHRSSLLEELEQLSGHLQEDGGVDALWNAYIDRVGTGADQLQTLAAGLQEGEQRSAVLLHNLFFTPAHQQLFVDRMKRMINGEMGTSPEWAQQQVKRWLERPASELP